MSALIRPLLLSLALALPAVHAQAQGNAPDALCKPGRTDSSPTSLGAGGWASVGGPVTGGCGATPSRIHHVYKRSQLVAALGKGKGKGKGQQTRPLDPMPKIVYVHGTIDLNVDDHDLPLAEESYMRACGWTEHATYYDPATGNQTGSGGFFGAYKATYDPALWLRQSLDAADNRPPVLSGPLEDARKCFQGKHAERIVIDVPSNTSIIGLGSDARIVNGNLRIGFVNQENLADPAAFKADNVVIRNITFADAFDLFPGWDPKDSFSITITNVNGCQATYDAAADAGPHRCVVRGGRWNSEYDSISVMNGERIWIDHNTFTDDPRSDKQFPPVFAAPFNEATQKVQHHDGQADVTLLGTRVTISNNVFFRHDKTNLLGGSDAAGLVPGYGPGRIDVTFHGNHFHNTVQRMPRVRFGRVHVYNNHYQVDRNSSAEYRLGDAWILGTASKLVTESNLFDISNNNLTVPRIINYSSSLANRQVCVAAGFTLAQCGTYYLDRDTWIAMLTPTTSSVQLYDAFAAVKAVQEANANNAPLLSLDPGDPAVFWLPSLSYGYEVAPINSPALQQSLRDSIAAESGAGKL